MPNKNQWGFILNPIAGNGYAGKTIEKVKQIIQGRNLNAEIILTERKYHATEIAREFLNKGCDHIVAVGGDGTINETAQVLVNVPDVKFGAVSAGKHLDNPHVNYYTTDKIHIEFPSKMPYHLDGEIFYDSTFDVTILPSNVNTICNPYGNHFFMR